MSQHKSRATPHVLVQKKLISGRSRVSSFAGEPGSGRGCAIGIDCRDDGKLQNRIRIGRGQHAVEFRQILHDCERFAKFHKRRFSSWRILQLRLSRHSYELWTDCRTVWPNSAARKQKGNMLTEQIE